jgi:hypothetical protein
MTHALPTISPPVELYRCAPRLPPRAIAQRFSALALLRHADGAADVRSSGKTGSDQSIAKPTRLTQLRHRASGLF